MKNEASTVGTALHLAVIIRLMALTSWRKNLEIVHIINMITLQNIAGKYHVTVVGDNI